MLVSEVLFRESKHIPVRPQYSVNRFLKCSSSKDQDILSLRRFVQCLLTAAMVARKDTSR